MSSHTSVSSAAADFWGKSPGASGKAINLRAEGAQAIASASSDSKADFKRMLAEASEEKSAARKAAERQNAEKQVESQRLEDKRQAEQRQEASQLEKQQLERQREEQRELERQAQERLYSSRDKDSGLNEGATNNSHEESQDLNDSDIDGSGVESVLEHKTVSADETGNQVGSQAVSSSLEDGEPEYIEQDPLLTSDIVASAPEEPPGQKVDSQVDDTLAVKEFEASSVVQSAPQHVEISLEELANAVAAFTGAGAEASGNAAGTWNARSFAGVSGGTFGMPGAASGVAYQGASDMQSFSSMMESSAMKAATADGQAQAGQVSAAGVLPGAAATPKQSSTIAQLQSQAIEQALGVSEAGGKDNPATELLREGGRNGSADGVLFAAAQRSEGRVSGMPQGTVQFTVPTSKGELGQPEWHNTVAEKVAVMATKNLSSAEIQLDPPELGQLQVRVTLNQDQASVSFSSQHAVVRDALDQTAIRLREMFDAEGLNLVDVDVSDQSFQQQKQQSEGSSLAGGAAGSEEVAAEPVVAQRSVGLVDHFV